MGEVSGRGGLAIGAYLAGPLLRGGGEQPSLDPNRRSTVWTVTPARCAMTGRDTRVWPLGEQRAGGRDDRLGGGLGGLGPGLHPVGPLPQPLTFARLHVNNANIKIFMLALLSPNGRA